MENKKSEVIFPKTTTETLTKCFKSIVDDFIKDNEGFQKFFSEYIILKKFISFLYFAAIVFSVFFIPGAVKRYSQEASGITPFLFRYGAIILIFIVVMIFLSIRRNKLRAYVASVLSELGTKMTKRCFYLPHKDLNYVGLCATALDETDYEALIQNNTYYRLIKKLAKYSKKNYEYTFTTYKRHAKLFAFKNGFVYKTIKFDLYDFDKENPKSIDEYEYVTSKYTTENICDFSYIDDYFEDFL